MKLFLGQVSNHTTLKEGPPKISILLKQAGNILLWGILLLAFGKKTEAQELSYTYVDSVTAVLFSHKTWPQLIQVGEQSIKEGIDYKFLRYRMGVAAFELKRYKEASILFLHALEYDNKDWATRDYLYWSLIYTGEPELASYYAPETEEGKSKYIKPISAIYIEVGGKRPTITDSVSNLYYGHFLLVHQLNKRLSIRHGFSYIKQEYQALPYSQPQYFLSASYVAYKRLIIKPAIHLAYGKAEVDYTTLKDGEQIRHHYELNRQISSSIIELSLPFDRITLNPGFMSSHSTTKTLYQERLRNQDHQGEFTKEISTDSLTKVIQTGMRLSYSPALPAGPILLSYGLFYHRHNQEKAWVHQARAQWRFKGQQEVTLKWMKSALPFTLEDNGRFLYNSPAVMKSKILVMFKMPLRPKALLYILGSHENMQEKSFTFDYYSGILGIEILL